jgi:hypothetical protein
VASIFIRIREAEKVTVSFSPNGYRTLITRLLESGYKVSSFEEVDPRKPDLILRHDVDMSLSAAVTIGRIERELNVSAAYFILLRSEMYNPFAPESVAGLNQLLDLGHEIGLHFDASLYPDDVSKLEAGVAEECRILEALCGREVRIVSFHRPSPQLLGLERDFAGRIHTYQPQFFDEIEYCSDSNGQWSHGAPFERDNVKEGKALQLLTHPIWWSTEAEISPARTLDEFVVTRSLNFRSELEKNCGVYRSGES